jgi:ribosome maturation protein Sdo1
MSEPSLAKEIRTLNVPSATGGPVESRKKGVQPASGDGELVTMTFKKGGKRGNEYGVFTVKGGAATYRKRARAAGAGAQFSYLNLVQSPSVFVIRNSSSYDQPTKAELINDFRTDDVDAVICRILKEGDVQQVHNNS